MLKKYKTPSGTQDFLEQECLQKNEVENKIISLFSQRGYGKVETPMLEYYDLFLDESANTATQNLFKFTDFDGELLVLRPDITLPISRIVATKTKGEKLNKFCYLGKCFNFQNANNRLREFTQAGVEVIGKNNTTIDAEIISLAIEALLAVGVEDFIIDVGQIKFFKALLAQLKLSNEEEAEFIKLVDKKDMLGIELFAAKKKLSPEVFEFVLKLPTLYGGEEILEKAMGYCSSKESSAAILELVEIYKILKTIGYSKYIAFDLSLVNGVSYYTGVVFKGLTKHFGSPIVSGGRYNNLCGDFFASRLPAVGFAIGIENVCTVLSRLKKTRKTKCLDVVIGYEGSQAGKAFLKISKLLAEGKVVDNSFAETKTELQEYAKGKNTLKIIFIEKSGREVEL